MPSACPCGATLVESLRALRGVTGHALGPLSWHSLAAFQPVGHAAYFGHSFDELTMCACQLRGNVLHGSLQWV